MNRLIVMALLVCQLTLSSVASENSTPVRLPKSLISALDALYEKCGDKSRSTSISSVHPNYGTLEEKIEILTISCDRNSAELHDAIKAFEKEKDCGYQYLHFTPFEPRGYESRGVAVTTNNGEIILRDEASQELWMLNVRNIDNPRLRDCYALVLNDGEKKCEGKIYLITSIRPDLNEQSPMQSISPNQSDNKINNDFENAMTAYQLLLDEINLQLNNAQDLPYAATYYESLYKQAEEITSSMKQLIDQYVKTIKTE